MRTKRWRLLCVAGALTIEMMAAGDTNLVISASTSGTLTWTNVNSNLYYSVEWCSSLSAPGEWTGSFRGLQDLRSANDTLTVPVPVFFRLAATDTAAHTRVLSPGTTGIAPGYYEGGDLVTIEADLLSENIRAGVTIFGVAGKPEVVDTSSGDALARDIAAGRKAWVDGNEITGTASMTIHAAPVSKSGQTAVYYPGDDGDLRPGVASPTPRFIVDSKRATVLDNLTGLMWTQNARFPGIPRWALGVDIIASCDVGSYTDWRMPSIKELQSLVDHGRFEPALPAGHPFQNVVNWAYWSSTTHPYRTNEAYLVFIWDGTTVTSAKTNNFNIWPVRGGEQGRPRPAAPDG